MDKVLCKSDIIFNVNGGIYPPHTIFFRSGELYDYNHNYIEDIYVMIDNLGYYKIFSNTNFQQFFYTPEETLAILRRNKIDKVLNDE